LWLCFGYNTLFRCPLFRWTCVKILKQLFASGSVIIGEYSPR
jgi:hypothetical protein